jgi:hypothetical protein
MPDDKPLTDAERAEIRRELWPEKKAGNRCPRCDREGCATIIAAELKLLAAWMDCAEATGQRALRAEKVVEAVKAWRDERGSWQANPVFAGGGEADLVVALAAYEKEAAGG